MTDELKAAVAELDRQMGFAPDLPVPLIDAIMDVRNSLSALSRSGEGWQGMETAPKGSITDDVGCRGPSEWFLGRPINRFLPAMIIRRRPWPQEDSWQTTEGTYVQKDAFDLWHPLPSPPAGEVG